jgi:hypothetical protein
MFRRDYHTINFIAFVLLGITLLSDPLHISTKYRPIPPRPLGPELPSTHGRHFSPTKTPWANGVFSYSPIPYTFLRRIGLAPYQDPLGTGCLLLLSYPLYISPKNRPSPSPCKTPWAPGVFSYSPVPTHFSKE